MNHQGASVKQHEDGSSCEGEGKAAVRGDPRKIRRRSETQRDFWTQEGDVLVGRLGAVASGFRDRFAESPLPAALAEAFGFVLPFVEVTLGTLLILGLFTRAALVAAGVLMIVLVFGTVIEPSPGTVVHNVTYALVIFALLWLSDYDRYSVDHYRRSGRQQA